MIPLKDFFPPPGEDSAPTRKGQLIEILVFLSLIVPSLIISLFTTTRECLSFPSLALATIFRDLALVGLILYFLWRNGEPRVRIGWARPFPVKELAVGLFIFIPFFAGAGLLATYLAKAGLSAPSTPLPPSVLPQGAGEFVLAFLLVLIVAVAEETIFRGYLILRLHSVTGNTTIAVLLSAALFSLGHGYEGTARMVTVFAMGIVLALIYLWRRSLVAPMVVHFLQDFIALVALPLLNRLH